MREVSREMEVLLSRQKRNILLDRYRSDEEQTHTRGPTAFYLLQLLLILLYHSRARARLTPQQNPSSPARPSLVRHSSCTPHSSSPLLLHRCPNPVLIPEIRAQSLSRSIAQSLRLLHVNRHSHSGVSTSFNATAIIRGRYHRRPATGTSSEVERHRESSSRSEPLGHHSAHSVPPASSEAVAIDSTLGESSGVEL
jgi:hypothetical protein